jgi:hypothetical protein
MSGQKFAPKTHALDFARATILGRRLEPRRSSVQGKKAYDRIV